MKKDAFILCLTILLGSLTAPFLLGKGDRSADLTVSTLVLTAPHLSPGGQIEVSFIVSKIGGPIGRFQVDVYLAEGTAARYLTSSNRIFRIDERDQPEGEISLAERRVYNLPSTFRPGRYFIIVWVDPDNRIPERDEHNNLRSAPFNVQPATPGKTVIKHFPEPKVQRQRWNAAVGPVTQEDPTGWFDKIIEPR